MAGRAIPMGPFTRVAPLNETYIKIRNSLRLRLFSSCKAEKKENSENVMKNVNVMSKMTMRESKKNSILVTRMRPLHSASQYPKNRRANKNTKATQPAPASAEGSRADHSEMPKLL